MLLRDPRDGGWTIADTGALVSLLLMFANRVSLFPNARFEGEGDDVVLVVTGGLDRLFFPAAMNDDVNAVATSGHVRLGRTLEMFAGNEWFSVKQQGGQVEIRRGQRARGLLGN